MDALGNTVGNRVMDQELAKIVARLEALRAKSNELVNEQKRLADQIEETTVQLKHAAEAAAKLRVEGR